jgi:FKBP-type peptidyl-prolyl cis-trans isomerase FklB
MFVTVFLVLFAASAFAADTGKIEGDKAKLSYTIGFRIGQSLKQDGLDVDAKVLTQAIQDVLSNSPLKMSMEDMQAAMQSFQQQQAKMQSDVAEKNLKAGQEFLAANKKKAGIVQTESGLQYKVLTKGKGKKPKDTDTVVVNYRGTLITGEEFDSSYKRGEPVTFPVNGVIPGWTEALQMMETGSKWQLFIPSKLAYDTHGAGGLIGPNATLIFDVELLEIK